MFTSPVFYLPISCIRVVIQHERVQTSLSLQITGPFSHEAVEEKEGGFNSVRKVRRAGVEGGSRRLSFPYSCREVLEFHCLDT